MARPREITCPNCGEVISDSAGKDWFTVRANLHEEYRVLWDEAVAHLQERMRREGGRRAHPNPRIAAGHVIELLCAEYLAGAREVSDDDSQTQG